MIGNKKNRFFFQRDNGYFRVYANYAFDREQKHKIHLSRLLTYNVKQSRAYTICANIANWSSGFSWRLMIKRSWVRIPTPFTKWIIFTVFCCKIVLVFEKTENILKRGQGWSVKNIVPIDVQDVGPQRWQLWGETLTLVIVVVVIAFVQIVI